MLKDRAKKLVQVVGRSRAGRQVIQAAVVGDPRDARFPAARWWPESIEGFEDIVFLFSSNQLNHGIISQELDEAALIYRLVRDRRDATVVEIGRFKGGSTFLVAAALAEGSEVWSYDVHAPHDASYTGADLDCELHEALDRYGLGERVQLIVADSRSATPPPRPINVLLVDGDHSYEGVAADWQHWGTRLAPGAHVLFHDAVDHGGVGTRVEGVSRLVAELDRDATLNRMPDAGGIAHFVTR